MYIYIYNKQAKRNACVCVCCSPPSIAVAFPPCTFVYCCHEWLQMILLFRVHVCKQSHSLIAGGITPSIYGALVQWIYFYIHSSFIHSSSSPCCLHDVIYIVLAQNFATSTASSVAAQRSLWLHIFGLTGLDRRWSIVWDKPPSIPTSRCCFVEVAPLNESYEQWILNPAQQLKQLEHKLSHMFLQLQNL